MDEFVIRTLAPFEKNDKNNKKWLEGYPVYEGYLRKALDDIDINKIAITGNYGIGKSSFIRCFAQENNKAFFYVSLENFRNESKPKDRVHIEYNLLKNIIYLCDQDTIKASGIELARENKTYKHIIITSIYSILLALVAFILRFPEKFSDFMHGIWSHKFYNISFHHVHVSLYVLAGILVSFGIGHLTYYILTHIRLSKLLIKASNSVGESETEITGKTILDEYGRELTYIFEELAKKYSLFVFEDFDRIDHTIAIDILGFLYDINSIVNSRLRKNSTERLKFCFTINDQIVSEMLATKYFDYIMPIIPELNSSMVCKYVESLLHDEGIFIPETEIIWDAIRQIDDYRKINQILNEFNILWSLELNKNTLVDTDIAIIILSFSIYKVVYPMDYYNIRLGESVIFPTYTANGDNTTDKLTLNVVEKLKGYLDDRCFSYIGLSEKMMLDWKKSQIISANDKNIKRDIILGELYQLKSNIDKVSLNDKGRWLCAKLLFWHPEEANTITNDIKILYFFDLVRCLLSMKSIEEKNRYFPTLVQVFWNLKEAKSRKIDEGQKQDVLCNCAGLFMADYSQEKNVQITSTAIVILHNNDVMDFQWLLDTGLSSKDIIHLFECLCANNDTHRKTATEILSNNKKLYEVIKANSNFVKNSYVKKMVF